MPYPRGFMLGGSSSVSEYVTALVGEMTLRSSQTEWSIHVDRLQTLTDLPALPVTPVGHGRISSRISLRYFKLRVFIWNLSTE